MVVSHTEHFALLKGLSQFFYSANKEEMRTAFLSVADAQQLPAIDWQKEEFAFNALFVGPAALLAPPFASAYLDPDKIVMGKITREVRSIYELVSLTLPESVSLPEDHIAIELDACLHMQTLAQSSHELYAVYSFFLHDHMTQWVPSFVQTAQEYIGVTPAISHMLALLEEWLRNACTANPAMHKEIV